MSSMLRFFGGVVLGAAVGAGLYVVMTHEGDEGVVADLKAFANNVVEQGRLAASERREELEIELAGRRQSDGLVEGSGV
jgi:hypothetical protein